jgi:hypothetical protein
MQDNHRTFYTGFGKQPFEIECNNNDAYQLASFLFADLLYSEAPTPPISFKLVSEEKQTRLSLWTGGRRLYFGDSRYQLAYILMNEVIYHSIADNNQQHAIHAGAVWKENQCIVLPGSSGKGKSTLTAWLVKHGYHYLTDELVFLSDNGQLTPFTRPVNLKVTSTHSSWMLEGDHQDQIISDKNGSMIPHRLLNPHFTSLKPYVTHILFPDFQEGTEMVCEKVSPARSSLYLMQSHVNARNLSGLGIPALSNIVRECTSYKLAYGSFQNLEMLFNSSKSPFSE